MQKTANIQGTDGGSVTLALPANFGLYRRRQELIAKRNAEKDPIERERINILIQMLESYDRATGMQRLAMATAIRTQMELMAI